MKTFALRLLPGQDLKQELQAFSHQLRAGCILTAVGSLQQATLRLAGGQEDRKSVV